MASNLDRPKTVALTFPTSVYPLEVVKRAAYRFTDRFSFDFALREDAVACVVTPLDPDVAHDWTDFENHFRNEVLDQDLRRSIASETAPLRDTILAYAFSNTGLQGVE